MVNWIITYLPLGSNDMTDLKTTEVLGDNKLRAQQYFSKYYEGKIVSIEGKL